MLKYLVLILFGFSVTTFAEEQITIFVNESNYVLEGSDKELDSKSLLNQLKKQKVKSVLLAVDVCAGPVILANVYVVLSELDITAIALKGVGKLEKGSCTNV